MKLGHSEQYIKLFLAGQGFESATHAQHIIATFPEQLF